MEQNGASTGSRGAIGPNRAIGPYALVRKLGEGGMGQVWLAEQHAPVRRRVALKLVRAGLYDDAVLQRFRAERQSLAVMNHPAIAKVFDAGATDEGQPYFVMEYVDGDPITTYCDRRKLRIRARLELFLEVCQGVQHAHQKAIIHRDLKPSNVLVSEVDGKPHARIIDFGIAKAISPDPGAEQTLFTRAGVVVGTPGYMSPEQADPTVADVDTRTDVFSLGVILFVLLTGTLPFETEGRQRRPFDEMLRQLRESDPPSPSASVRAATKNGAAIAAARGTGPAQLAGALRGDLDRITLKAMDRDRTRRYGTPSELAADLGRYMRNEPVTARPASAGYRLRKYARRHRVGVTLAAGMAMLLAGFVAVQAASLRRITRERDRANRITDFMTNMFDMADPSKSRGNTITAREVLDTAYQTIDKGLATDPELQAQLILVMARVYDNLGLYARSQPLAAHALEIDKRVLGPKATNTIVGETLLGFELWRLDRYAEAEQHLRGAFRDSRDVLGAAQPTTIDAEHHLALTLFAEGKHAEAELLMREALENSRRTFGSEGPVTLAMMHGLFAILGDEGKYAESEKVNREYLELSLRINGVDDPSRPGALSSLADTLSDEGRYAEAENYAQQAMEAGRRILGPKHPSTAAFTYNLACLAALQGEKERALVLLRQAVEIGLRRGTALKIPADDDLKSLHGLPAFDEIVAEARERANASPGTD
jgi:non-specific serine/threonine protein kinase/serine/threonine-protein kinase